MAVSVALGHAVKVYWKVEGGTLIDLTCYVTGVDIRDNGNPIDVAHYCNPRDSLVGVGETSATINGYHTDETTTQKWNSLSVNDLGTLYIYPNGVTATTPPTSLDYRFLPARVVNKNWGSGVNAGQTWTLEFRGVDDFITGVFTPA